MSVAPLPAARGPDSNRPGRRFASAARAHRLPSPGGIARRRLVIRLTKWLLPAAALALLAIIALWPEIDRTTDHARLSFHRMTAEVDGARLTDARYRGVDAQGRPYTLTAAIAKQAGPERINLTAPSGDMVLQNGTWLMLQSKDGVYMQQAQQLDLSHDVVLYRDDGLTMRTESAAVDLKNGAAAGSEPVHAEGPFGTLEAQGFSLVDKGQAIQFAGPARLMLNGATP
jgi:lipopolysaccharide export system protein LptC